MPPAYLTSLLGEGFLLFDGSVDWPHLLPPRSRAVLCSIFDPSRVGSKYCSAFQKVFRLPLPSRACNSTNVCTHASAQDDKKIRLLLEDALQHWEVLDSELSD